MDVSKIINGPAMWIFALLVVGAAITQSVVMFRYARKYVRQTNLLSEQELRTCMKTGGVVSIGPALSVFVISLSMISMLGGPFTLMRLAMIGSASTEFTAASIGTGAAGVALGADALTGKAFTAALWTCAVMSSGYLIFVPFVTRGVGKALNRVLIPAEGKKRSKLSWVLSRLLPLLIFLGLSYMQAKQGLARIVSMIVGAVFMLVLNLLAKKLDKKWMREWSMAISVLFGIIIGGVTNALI